MAELNRQVATLDPKTVEIAKALLEAMRVRDEEIAAARNKQHDAIRRRMKEIRAQVTAETKVDPGQIDWYAPSLSVKRLKESLFRAYTTRKLREAVAETSFGQLLRYGVQNYLFDAYQNVPTVYQAIYESRPSSNRQEWYAPLYGAEIPEDVDASGHFDDSRIRGLDVQVINKKVGRILSIERELVDDDQTGQIVNRATRLGERMRYKEELDGMSAIVNAFDYSTGAATAAYDFTAIGNAFSGGNRALTQTNLEQAAIAMRKIRDPLGNFMLVLPDTVLVGPDNEINLYKLLNSAYQPAIPGSAGENIGNAASGQTGWTLTVNWLTGKYTPVVSTFLAHPAVAASLGWWLMQAKKGAICQERDPLEVVQENPLSGAAFETDAYRYRVRRRYRHAVIEPRFIFQGSNQNS